MITTLPVIMDDVNPSEPDVKGSGKKIAQAAEHLKIQPPGTTRNSSKSMSIQDTMVRVRTRNGQRKKKFLRNT